MLSLCHNSEKMTGPEVSAIQTKALAPNQPDPIPDAIVRVCEEIRGFISANSQNLPMGSGMSIPSKLADTALALIVHRVASRLPAKVLMTQERVAAKNDALALLHDVAAIPPRFRIDRPAANQIDTVENIGNMYPAYSSMGRHRRFTPREQIGT